MSSAIIVLLGPGRDEIDRASDLFDSIVSNELERVHECDVYVVSEYTRFPADLESATHPFLRRFHVLNPAGEARHPLDHMTSGMLRGLSEIARRGPYEFVLKLDTDALVIRPFYDQLVALFATQPQAGMAGSYLRFPDGSTRNGLANWAPRVRSAMRVLSIRRALKWGIPNIPSYIRLAIHRRRLLREARRLGYIDGHHVLGGSYALSGKVVDSWQGGALKSLESLFSRTQLSEDVVVSLLVVRSGYDLIDFNAPGEVFGTWHRELGAEPEVLLDRYAIIHSVKSSGEQDEQTLRDVFRRHRGGGAGRTEQIGSREK